MLIGGGGEKKTLRLVAEYGDIWHSFSDSTEYLQKSDVLARHCADLGVTLLTVGANGPDYDLSDAEALCRWRDQRAAK